MAGIIKASGGTRDIARVARGFAAALAIIVPVAGASASEANNWANFASADGAYSGSYTPQTYDHSFAREWEANPPKGFPTLSRENLSAMKDAIKRYSDIVAQGGWKPVPETQLQPGASGPAVALLRERLAMSGDLKSNDDYGMGMFEGALERAVRRFQASNGLTPTGIVDKRTIAALNVPAAARLRQLQTNFGRLTEMTRGALPKRYVVVNIPAAQIEAVEGDHVVSRHAGVVGKTDRQTPILRSQIHELNFNPVWHLPPTVISKDLVPKGRDMARKGQDVLAKFGIDAYGADGRKLDSSKVKWDGPGVAGLTYRQKPGPENPLGFVKINFHNSHSVYMHDTPSDRVFGRNFRAASSGCVRVQGIENLAAWLMEEQGWDKQRVLAMKKSGERLDVRLKKPMPLFFVYITAWATEDGVVQFRRDLYERDGIGKTASTY